MRTILLLCALTCSRLLAANSVYIGPSSAGSGNGTSCGNAESYTYFNTSGNWSATPSGVQIGPGTTVHLCSGTYSFSNGTSCGLTFQGSGANGNLVTLIADQGAATITAGYWAGSSYGGPVCTNGQSHYVINGDNNLTLQATANGTNLTYQEDYGTGIYDGNTGSDILIENLTIANIYVHACTPGGTTLPVTNCPDESGINTSGILFINGSAVTWQNLTAHDVKWCLNERFGAASVGLTIQNNTLYDCDHGVAVGDAGTGDSLTTLTVTGNSISNGYMWDDNGNLNHHDGVHVFVNNPASSSTSGCMVYNNYVFGNWGLALNGFYFFEGLTSNSCQTFNNLGVDGATTLIHQGCGYICATATSQQIYNNTIVGAGTNQGLGINTSGSDKVENNVLTTMQEATQLSGTNPTTWDYNSYYNIGSNGWNLLTFSGWKSTCSCDSHSIQTNPLLSGTYSPQVSSPLIGAGVNLTSLSIVALDSDAAGLPRPSSGAWTIGAYNSAGFFGSSGNGFTGAGVTIR